MVARKFYSVEVSVETKDMHPAYGVLSPGAEGCFVPL